MREIVIAVSERYCNDERKTSAIFAMHLQSRDDFRDIFTTDISRVPSALFEQGFIPYEGRNIVAIFRNTVSRPSRDILSNSVREFSRQKINIHSAVRVDNVTSGETFRRSNSPSLVMSL